MKKTTTNFVIWGTLITLAFLIPPIAQPTATEPVDTPVSIIVQGRDLATAERLVTAAGGEISHRLNVIDSVVARLTALADRARADLGDRGKPGKGQRRIGRIENPTPRLVNKK